MLIAHVTFSVAPENRPRALDILMQEVPAIRNMHGCVTFTPFLDPTSQQGIGILQEWRSRNDFNAYLASANFKTVGAFLGPLMTAPPISKRFDASLIENVD